MIAMTPSFWQGLEQGIYWITPRIAIVRFATPERCQHLLAQGVTHILNVAEGPSLAETRLAGFQSVVDVPIVDLARIPDDVVLRCLDRIDEALRVADSKLYVHCTAGQNRSPTVLWLYLVACGTDPESAKRLIVRRCPDAIPGHGHLVDAELIELARQHGTRSGMAAVGVDLSDPPQ